MFRELDKEEKQKLMWRIISAAILIAIALFIAAYVYTRVL